MNILTPGEAKAALAEYVALHDQSKAIKDALRDYVTNHGPIQAQGFTAAFVERSSFAYPAAEVLEIVKGDPDVPPLMFNRMSVRPLLLQPSPYAEAINAVGVKQRGFATFEITNGRPE